MLNWLLHFKFSQVHRSLLYSSCPLWKSFTGRVIDDFPLQYFLKTGTCKYGSTCKYHHPRDRHGAGPILLNILGLPMRQVLIPFPLWFFLSFLYFFLSFSIIALVLAFICVTSRSSPVRYWPLWARAHTVLVFSKGLVIKHIYSISSSHTDIQTGSSLRK